MPVPLFFARLYLFPRLWGGGARRQSAFSPMHPLREYGKLAAIFTANTSDLTGPLWGTIFELNTEN
jgi:hypothetical protein